MKVVALFIADHEYLFDNEPQTINFGGKYFYSFKQINKKSIEVKKEINNHYIDDFYKSTETTVSIELISAIVGENGIGKTSILNQIIADLRYKHQDFTRSKTVVLVEEHNSVRALYTYCNLYLVENNEQIIIESFNDKEVLDFQTIYYSPALDLKYDFDFEPDKYDLSIDNTIDSDLEDINHKGVSENGFPYSATQELVFKNSKRQIAFLASDIVKNVEVFKTLFEIPRFNQGVIYLREGNIKDSSFWNTPSQFREILSLIKKRADDETKNWNRKSEKKSNKLFLRKNTLLGFLSIIIKQFEKNNTFLEEGIFPEPYNMNRYDKMSAKDIFFDFIREAFVLKDGKTKVFNHINIEKLYNKLEDTFSKDENLYNGNNKSFKASLNDIEEILDYDNEFVRDLFLYYPKTHDENTIDKGNYIDGFISFMPTDKKLSSGQNALLNFFSRLYDFLKSNLIGKARFLPEKRYYLLLLDEADLGFHPQWKKLFIKSLVNSLPYFFEMLEKKPALQIIFTTHDPLTLSDLPNSNVVYIAKRGNKSTILNQTEKGRPTKTFGANISDLLADSFFINNGLIGEFAKDKIETTIKWINENKVKKKADFEKELKFHKKIIEIIDERVIKLKLAEMISELETNNDFAKEMINNEIKVLGERLNTL